MTKYQAEKRGTNGLWLYKNNLIMSIGRTVRARCRAHCRRCARRPARAERPSRSPSKTLSWRSTSLISSPTEPHNSFPFVSLLICCMFIINSFIFTVIFLIYFRRYSTSFYFYLIKPNNINNKYCKLYCVKIVTL